MPKVTSRRTCIGCRAKKAKSKLIRIVLNKKRETVIDPEAKIPGRGAYLCKCQEVKDRSQINKKCLEMAIKKRAFNYQKLKFIKNW